MKKLILILVFSGIYTPAFAAPSSDFHCPSKCIDDPSWCKDHLETCLENCKIEDLAICSYYESKAMCEFCSSPNVSGKRANGVCESLCNIK